GGDPGPIAWSRDSQRFAIAYQRSIFVFDRAGREILQIRGHTQPVVTIAYSPDGKTIASGSYGNTVRTWNASTGQSIRKLAGHTKFIKFVTYSPDGFTVASASADNTIRLWDVATGEQRAVLSGHTGDVLRVVYAPNGKTLASLSEDQSVRLWDAFTGQAIQTIDNKAEFIDDDAFAISADGKSLHWTTRTKYGEPVVQQWDLVANKEIPDVPQSARPEQAINISPDGTLGIANNENRVELRDVATNKPIRAIQAHAQPFRSLAYAQDGKALAATTDVRVHTWMLALQPNYRASDWIVTPLPLWPSADMVDRLLEQMYHEGHELDERVAIAVASDGKFVAFGLQGNTMALYDLASHEMIRSFPAQRQPIVKIRVSPDDKTLAVRLEDGTVQLWDAASGATIRTLGKRERIDPPTDGMEFASDGKTIATTSQEALRVWNVHTGEVVQTFTTPDDPWVNFNFSPDGRTLAVATSKRQIQLLDVATGKSRLTLRKGIEFVEFSPDSKALLGGAEGRRIRILDATTGKELHKLVGADGELHLPQYTPNGRLIAGIEGDGSLDLFDANTGKLVATARALPLREMGDEEQNWDDDTTKRPFEASYVFAPSGHIDIMGRDACAVREYPVCHVGTMAFPFDVCEERLRAPGLLGQLHEGEASYLEPEAAPLMMDCNNIPSH
ncbi:MAG TPA: WD40 repeat domain-containing protein, partial [Polyangium sp.]|nr:WD40 repeat domain-containing protein [Polyangium sp.]